MRRQSVVLAGGLGLMMGVGGLCVWRAAGGAQQAAATSHQSPVTSDQSASRSTPISEATATRMTHRSPLTIHHSPDYELIVRRNLFRPLVQKKGRRGEEEKRKDSSFAYSPIRPLSPSGLTPSPRPLPFRMAGMIDTGWTPVALLEEVNTGRYQAVKAGDKVAGIEVVRVEAEQVIVNAAGMMRTLPLRQGENQAAANPERAPNVQLEKRIIPDSEQ